MKQIERASRDAQELIESFVDTLKECQADGWFDAAKQCALVAIAQAVKRNLVFKPYARIVEEQIKLFTYERFETITK